MMARVVRCTFLRFYCRLLVCMLGILRFLCIHCVVSMAYYVAVGCIRTVLS